MHKPKENLYVTEGFIINGWARPQSFMKAKSRQNLL